MKDVKVTLNDQSNKPSKIVLFALDHPKLLTIGIIIISLFFIFAMRKVKVDTDPENMLSEKETVRIFHKEMKKVFNLHDMVILGVVNERHPDGVFNPDSLGKIYEMTEFIKTLRWPDPEHEDKEIGIVPNDLLTPSTVDNIKQAGPGTVRFEWLMAEPPKTREQALEIRDNARANPLLYGTLLSEDEKALCLYIPITSKDLSYKIYTELNKKIATLKGEEQYYITGLPVAEDTFGVEMFKQMAMSAPLAMLVIFLLMFFFFRKILVILSPMILAMVSVIWTMGLKIALGYPVHIMSSMIPIFIMPIAVLDSIHINSEFFDRYQSIKDKRKTMEHVMNELFTPMLYTSLTTIAGFSSLALTPIPPVQVFGLSVAFGVAVAWILTVTFVPAFTMFIREESLKNFGMKTAHGSEEKTLFVRVMNSLGRIAYDYAKIVLLLTAIIAIIAYYGIRKIQVNDNPVKWFTRSHPIRVADTVLNNHFGGTYMAYLVLEPAEKKEKDPMATAGEIKTILNRLKERMKDDYPQSGKFVDQAMNLVSQEAQKAATPEDLVKNLQDVFEKKADEAGDEDAVIWEEVIDSLQEIPGMVATFKRPEILRYISELQGALQKTDVVGKSNSITNVVKKVYQELMEGKEEYHVVPETPSGVAQCLISYQSSHKPDDLWHLVTPDHEKANIWVQLKSGDNKDMSRVAREIDRFMKDNPPPSPLGHKWFGLTYINVIWQDRMVFGMLQSFLGSFLIVFIMMMILYRSVLWGAISMIPMSVTVGVIYGFIGFIGKDYDMPVAVLSALTLGLAIDFGIHFLTRARVGVLRSKGGTWKEARGGLFGEPARAISRNIIVIAVGFLPLLAAPLIPYKTVGVFFSAILGLSGIATLVILPSLIEVFHKRLFIRIKEPLSTACNCGLCATVSIASVILIVLNLHQYFHLKISGLAILSIILIPLLGLICGILSRRNVCRVLKSDDIQNR
jgi:predicted RND superfamily exporter protein